MKLLALGEISQNFSNRSIIDHLDAEITTEVRLNKQLKLSLVLALLDGAPYRIETSPFICSAN